MLRVLCGFEFSGTFRRAFRALGHDAWSVDLEPAADSQSYHIQGDIRDHLDGDWDLAVLHPPCTRLTLTGVRWLHSPPRGKTKEQMWAELDEGCELFSLALNADIPCLAVENPVMHGHARDRIVNYRPPEQTVQPWWFGAYVSSEDNVKKGTCWWLKNLSPLSPLGILDGSTARPAFHMSPGSSKQSLRRSITPASMAAAAVDQWAAEAEAFHGIRSAA